jgi:hypothetical protein
MTECLLLAQSGRAATSDGCPIEGTAAIAHDLSSCPLMTHFGYHRYYLLQAALPVNSHSAVTMSARVGNPASLPRCWIL